MNLSRRTAMKLSAAAVVTITLPAIVAQPHEYAYLSDHDDFWRTGFATREQALAAGEEMSLPGRSFKTAWIESIPMLWPTDIGEDAGTWLLNGGPLGNAMAEWLISANEAGDYDGSFGDACFGCDREGLDAQGRVIVAAALRRLGCIDMAAIVEVEIRHPGGVEFDDATWNALSSDVALERDLLKVIRQWAEEHSLENDLNGLDIYDVQDHAVIVRKALA